MYLIKDADLWVTRICQLSDPLCIRIWHSSNHSGCRRACMDDESFFLELPFFVRSSLTLFNEKGGECFMHETS